MVDMLKQISVMLLGVKKPKMMVKD